jgi:hypothetical protein
MNFFWLYALFALTRAQKCTNGNYLSQRMNACKPCPRGRFGSFGTCVTCPQGRYNNALGVESVLDCNLCEPGTYQSDVGSVTCGSKCPDGTYSTKWGSTSSDDCKTCPRGLASYQCGFDVEKRTNVVVDKNNRFPSSAFVSSGTRTNTKQHYVSPNKCGGLYNVCMTKHIQ